MKRKLSMLAAVLLMLGASSLYLASCGSSGGSGSGTGSTPAFSKGVITAKGSIFVNGVEYQTGSSSITMEGTPNHVDSELQVGMVVEVKGRKSDDGMNGEGSEIEYKDNLEGPLTSVVTGTTSTLTALDQTILVDANTHLRPNGTTVSTLAAAVAITPPLIEVSGFTDNTGTIHATFIELKSTSPSAGDPIEIKGTIATGSTNTTSHTFRIGALNVAYGSAASLHDFPAGGIADGQFVEVKSTLGQYNAGTHTLVTADVEYQVEMAPGEDDSADVEGYVANYDAGAKTFTVNGISVNGSSATLPAGLANGSKVEAEGRYSGGVLNATKVVLKTSL